MVNKHTIDYHPNPSQLTSRIHRLIFPWTPKGFVSPKSFLNFFLNLHIPPWLRKSFKFMVLRLLANTCVKKIESVHFYSCPQEKLSPRSLSLPPRQKENTHSSRTLFSEDLCFPSRKEGEIMELKQLPKLNLHGYWSQVLINFTISATFTFFISVLLCHNLASQIFTKKNSLQEYLHEIYNLAVLYFLTISPTICQIKSLSLNFSFILKSFIPLFY